MDMQPWKRLHCNNKTHNCYKGRGFSFPLLNTMAGEKRAQVMNDRPTVEKFVRNKERTNDTNNCYWNFDDPKTSMARLHIFHIVENNDIIKYQDPRQQVAEIYLADYPQRHHPQVENHETKRNPIHSLVSCARQVICAIGWVFSRTPSLERVEVDESSAPEILHYNRHDYKTQRGHLKCRDVRLCGIHIHPFDSPSLSSRCFSYLMRWSKSQRISFVRQPHGIPA